MVQAKTKNLILAAFCLALGLVLPSAFHVIGAGPVFLPMHIPVLLCGMLCGWQYGLAVGFIVPLFSSVLTGMPPIFPTAPAMMLELGCYGFLTGALYQKLSKNLYLSLLLSMFGGRLVSGIANAIFLGIANRPYGFSAFISGAFITSLPGIVLQLVLVPLLVVSLQKTGLCAPPAKAAV